MLNAVDVVNDLMVYYEGLSPSFVELYKDLHAHPELSFCERRTAAIVSRYLREFGYKVIEGVGGTGVVGVLSNGDGACVLSRADMDALPISEATGLPYSSTESATDARGMLVGVMHACGHDTHVVTLLAAARLLSEHRSVWSGTFIPIFQPAEEVAGGARAMVADGLVGVVPRPDVALAQHVAPLPYDTVAAAPGPVQSAADSIRITVYGRGTHGSAPQGGVDPVLLAATIAVRLNTIVSREIRPGTFGVVTVGSLHAGTKSNVIADSAELLVNTRAYDDSTRQALHASIERIVWGECFAAGSPCDPVFEYYDKFDLTINDEKVFARVNAALSSFFGDKLVRLEPSTGSEDFGVVPDAFEAPYLYWKFGSLSPERYFGSKDAGFLKASLPGIHSSSFAPVPGPTLRTGTASMLVGSLAYLLR